MRRTGRERERVEREGSEREAMEGLRNMKV